MKTVLGGEYLNAENTVKIKLGIVGTTVGTGDHYTKCYYLDISADHGYGAANKPDAEGKYIAKTAEELKRAATYVDWNTAVWSLTDGAYPTLLPDGDA